MTIAKKKKGMGLKERLCSRPRAVWDHEKESRLQDLLTSAANLFARSDFADITVRHICDEAGLAKGTFYLYFDTKEAAFLALTRQLVGTWSAAVEADLGALAVNPPAARVAEILALSFRPVPQLPRLLQMLHSILERKVSEPDILAFKRALAENMNRQRQLIARLLPALGEERINQFMIFGQIVLTGAWEFANPPGHVRTILETNGLGQFLIDFEKTVTVQVETFLTGLGVAAPKI